jgi:anaerobic magnesium-protoporphyrin IX monomethyl ester cyclase
MRVLLVQPPRRYWPYVAAEDNYLVQQALPALAAVARQDGHEVKVIDCLPVRMGWRTLHQEIADYQPDIIGCGENHALYTNEALRFFELCKSAAPEAMTIAGGGHFSNMAHRYAGLPTIDAICIGEGEQTFSELCAAFAKSDPDLSAVDGVAFGEGDQFELTTPRKLIADLDSLPMPAYDLMPMAQYGRSRYLFSPSGATLHHSRGCTSSCSFCAWWTTMADRTIDADGKTHLSPRWRTKSVDRMMEETEELYYRYGKRGFVWVDESWNINPRFNLEYSERMIASGMKTKWMTFMRADCIVRDEEKGILAAQVEAGMRHILIGVERAGDDSLAGVNKRFYAGGVAEQAIAIFKEKYPQVFIQATFIVGLKEENPRTLDNQVAMAKHLDVDFPAFHPITPVPGTPIYDDALANGHITEEDFDNFDWMSPVLDSDFMTRHEIADELHRMNKQFVNPKWMLKGLLSKESYKRDMYIWFTKVSAQMWLEVAKQRLNPFAVEHYQQLVEPDWYNS